jgi:hypothetical protein
MLHATPPPVCRGADLAGRFAVVRGSAGAGNVVYRLTVTKTTPGVCFVTGIPRLQLLSRQRKPLPTQAMLANRGMGTAVRVVLRKGGTTSLTARFSPDVPPACGVRAWKLRVRPGGGGSFTVPVAPATRVCQRGRLQLDPWTAK